MLNFDDGVPDTGNLDHSAHAMLQESERRGGLSPPPTPPRTRLMHSFSYRVDTEALTTEEGEI